MHLSRAMSSVFSYWLMQGEDMILGIPTAKPLWTCQLLGVAKYWKSSVSCLYSVSILQIQGKNQNGSIFAIHVTRIAFRFQPLMSICA